MKKVSPEYKTQRWSEADLRMVNISLALQHQHIRRVLDVVGKGKTKAENSDHNDRPPSVYLIAEYCDCRLDVSTLHAIEQI